MNSLKLTRPRALSSLGVLYRYDEHLSIGFEGGPTTVKLRMRDYDILRKTKRGSWIDIGCGMEKFVLDVDKTSRKRFAYPTPAEALESYICRKKKQIKIYEARLDTAQRGLELAFDLERQGIPG